MRDTPAEPTLYTQDGCAESVDVRTWLVEHGVSFTERDAGSAPDAARALAATGIFATPLLVIGDDRVLGFQEQALAALLGGASPTIAGAGPETLPLPGSARDRDAG
jgi:glutaredoxin